MNALPAHIARAFSWLLVAPIWLYQLAISPLLGQRCRFEPTCSSYAIQAINRRGPLMGLWLALKRVAQCHPWGGQGYDPVPPPRQKTNKK